jgi:aconitate hydratase
MKEEAAKNGWPTKVEVGLIGSCTNSVLMKILHALLQFSKTGSCIKT